MYDFTGTVKNNVLIRQNYRCAICNKRFTDTYYIDYHHVIPKQTAKIFKKDSEFIKSVDNCVAVHNSKDDLFDCHYYAHAGNYRTGAVGLPDLFKYAFLKKTDHSAWSSKINQMWNK